MRTAQLAIGWVVLAALTAGGTYFGLIELDAKIDLQAHLGRPKTQQVAVSAPPPSGSVNPAVPPPSQTAPPPAVHNPDPTPPKGPAPSPITTQPGVNLPVNPAPPPGANQGVGTVTTPADTGAAKRINPPAEPKISKSEFQEQYDGRVSEANELFSFFADKEQEYKSNGMSLRPEIKAAVRSCQKYLNETKDAMLAGKAGDVRKGLAHIDEELHRLQDFK